LCFADVLLRGLADVLHDAFVGAHFEDGGGVGEGDFAELEARGLEGWERGELDGEHGFLIF